MAVPVVFLPPSVAAHVTLDGFAGSPLALTEAVNVTGLPACFAGFPFAEPTAAATCPPPAPPPAAAGLISNVNVFELFVVFGSGRSPSTVAVIEYVPIADAMTGQLQPPLKLLSAVRAILQTTVAPFVQLGRIGHVVTEHETRG